MVALAALDRFDALDRLVAFDAWESPPANPMFRVLGFGFRVECRIGAGRGGRANIED